MTPGKKRLKERPDHQSKSDSETSADESEAFPYEGFFLFFTCASAACSHCFHNSKGEGGELVSVRMASVEASLEDDSVVRRAKKIMVQLTAFGDQPTTPSGAPLKRRLSQADDDTSKEEQDKGLEDKIAAGACLSRQHSRVSETSSADSFWRPLRYGRRHELFESSRVVLLEA